MSFCYACLCFAVGIWLSDQLHTACIRTDLPSPLHGWQRKTDQNALNCSPLLLRQDYPNNIESCFTSVLHPCITCQHFVSTLPYYSKAMLRFIAPTLFMSYPENGASFVLEGKKTVAFFLFIWFSPRVIKNKNIPNCWREYTASCMWIQNRSFPREILSYDTVRGSSVVERFMTCISKQKQLLF